MRYWFDSEFIENGITIDLISIGFVAEDGREYYGQFSDFSYWKASEWVRKHVYPALKRCVGHEPPLFSDRELIPQLTTHRDGRCGVDCPWRTRYQIGTDLLEFLEPARYGKPELWGYYADYDHVALCQLYGPMSSLPDGWPMYTRDLKQWCDELGNPPLPEQGKGEHNALADARWNKIVWEFLRERQRSTTP